VSHEWLSGEQEGRYGRFVADPTPEELERFFFLDEAALAEVQTRRGLHIRRYLTGTDVQALPAARATPP
jgi:hypothetical protein